MKACGGLKTCTAAASSLCCKLFLCDTSCTVKPQRFPHDACTPVDSFDWPAQVLNPPHPRKEQECLTASA